MAVRISPARARERLCAGHILLIPGTSSVAHLRENVAGAGLPLSDEDLAELDKIGRQDLFRVGSPGEAEAADPDQDPSSALRLHVPDPAP